MPWAADCSASSKRVIFRGDGHRCVARVMRGSLKGDPLRVLRGLGQPLMLRLVVERTWKARHPKVAHALVHDAVAAKRLELYTPRGKRIVLAFQTPVPKQLIDALNGLFRLPEPVSLPPLPVVEELSDAQVDEGEHVDLSRQEVQPVEGDDAGRGQAPEDLDGRGVQAVEQVVAVRSHRARKRRKKRS